MPIPIFDTLKYANALKAADVPNKQAEIQETLLGDALAVNLKELVTKDDLKQMEDRLTAKIDGKIEKLDAKIEKLDAKIDKVDAKFEAKFDGLRSTMNILLTMMLALLALGVRTLFVKP